MRTAEVPDRLRVLAALGAVCLWASNATAGGFALDRLTAQEFLVIQFGVATLVFGAVRLLRPLGRPAGRRVDVWTTGVVGVAGTMILQYFAFATAPLVGANVIAYAWPLVATVVLALAGRDRRAVSGVPPAILGFGGMVLIVVSGNSDPGGATDPGPGYLAAIGSALCMAWFTVRSERLGTSPPREVGPPSLHSATGSPGSTESAPTVRVRPDSLMLPGCAVGLLVAVVLCVATGSQWPPMATTWTSYLTAAYVGFGPMAIGYGLWSYAMSDRGARVLAPLGYGTPLLSTGLLLATGHPATPGMVAGAILVLAGCLGVLVLIQRSRSSGNARR